MIDAGERIISGLCYKYIHAMSGSAPLNIELTLYVEIWKIIEEIMDNQIVKGVVIVMKPITGK